MYRDLLTGPIGKLPTLYVYTCPNGGKYQTRPFHRSTGVGRSRKCDYEARLCANNVAVRPPASVSSVLIQPGSDSESDPDPRDSKEHLRYLYAQHPRNWIFCTLIYSETFCSGFVGTVNSLV